MKKIIHTPKAPAPIGPYSQAVQVGDFLYISGQIPIDPATGELVAGSIEAEAQQVMKNLEAILAAAGMTFFQVVKTSIFLQNMDDFAAVNAVYGSFFSGEYPARETVAVAGLPKGVRVEISVIAVQNEG